MNVAFFVRHFTERGTEVAIYDYAKYNEEILNNKSYIICFNEKKQKEIGFPTERTSYNKFNKRFKIIEICNIEEIEFFIGHYNFQFFYTLTHGGPNDIYRFDNKSIWRNCKTIKHCVLATTFPEGDFYIGISNFLNVKYNTKFNIIPHIVTLPICEENLRLELNIPKDAIVFGRHGGFTEFNIIETQQVIIEFLNSPSSANTWFLFLNTQEFYTHPRIIYLEKNIDLIFKTKFINTCDAMIHARAEGETFGLCVAEFSIKNKPVITCPIGDLAHIEILGDKAVLYRSKEEILYIFNNIKNIIKNKEDWNAHKQYTPENVMRLFNDLILKSWTFKRPISRLNHMSLEEIVDNSRTDKNTLHSYLPLYNKLLLNKKETAKNVLEVGICYGGSIKLWSDFFTNATVYGIDIMNIDYVWEGIKNNEKIILHTSTDAYSNYFFITHFLNKNIKCDFMLDDGPHTLESMKQFIKLYSQIMTDDGILIIEDVQSLEWIDILKNEVPENLKQFIKIYDLRQNINRYDDIVFTIDKSNN